MELLCVCSARIKKQTEFSHYQKWSCYFFLFVEHERRGSKKLFILPYVELFLKMVGVRKALYGFLNNLSKKDKEVRSCFFYHKSNCF